MTFFTLLNRRSDVPGHAPTTSQLQLGEIAINTHDGLLYFVQNSANASIVCLGSTPNTANALTTPRTITLNGDLIGSVVFDGSSDVILNANFSGNTAVTTKNTTTDRALSDRFADVSNVKDEGAIGDGNIAILNFSMNPGSNVISVSAIGAWVANTAYSAGTVVANNFRSYSCVVGGTSGSVGPIYNTMDGSYIVDGTAKWAYLGGYSPSANVFTPNDVGKVISVVRQDVFGGWSPFWDTGTPVNGATSYGAHAFITGYISPTVVTVSVAGSPTPPGPPTYAYQSWPYASTPSIISWGTDNSLAFQRALNKVAGSGGAVFVPSGGYCFASRLVIGSGTTLYGSGDSSLLIPCGVHDGNNQSANVPFIVNSAYVARGGVGIPSNNIATQRALYGNVDIKIEKLKINMRLSGTAIGSFSLRFFLAENVNVNNVSYIGSPMSGFEAANFLACYRFKSSENNIINTFSGFSPFDGSTSGTFAKNRVVISPISAPVAQIYLSRAYGVNIRASGSAGNDEIISDFTIIDNDIFLNGTILNSSITRGIAISSGSDSSGIKNIFVNNNRIVCNGNYNNPIMLAGACNNIDVDDNMIIGADGQVDSPIQFFTLSGDNRQNLPTSIETTINSTVLIIHWINHGYSGINQNQFPVILTTNSGPTIAGQLINGNYKLLSVIDANTISIELRSPASATAAVNWNSNGYANIVQFPKDVYITNNKLIDCAAPSDALIDAQGIAIVISDNDAYFSNATTTPNYTSLVRFNGYVGNKSASIINNTGPSGSGSLLTGFGGNNRVTWNGYESMPFVVDTDEVGQRIVMYNDLNIHALTAGNSQFNGVANFAAGILVSSPSTFFNQTSFSLGTSNTFDPDQNVARAIKIFSGGMAVVGGIKTDDLLVTNSFTFTNFSTLGDLSAGGNIISNGSLTTNRLVGSKQSYLNLSTSNGNSAVFFQGGANSTGDYFFFGSNVGVLEFGSGGPSANVSTTYDSARGSGTHNFTANVNVFGKINVSGVPLSDSSNTVATTAFVKNQGYISAANAVITGTLNVTDIYVGGNRVISEGTDLGNAAVSRVGSTAPARSLGKRLAVDYNVLDFGADPTGVVSCILSFNNARQAAQNAGGGTVRIPAGIYNMDNSTVYTVSNVIFEFDSGVTLIGGQILGLVDQVNNNHGKVYAKFTNDQAGGFTNFSSMFVGDTGGGPAYEKGAMYARVHTGDHSSIDVDRDAVALQLTGEILPGNPYGRVWGVDIIASAQPFSDGYVKGIEVAVENYGSDQPNVDQTTSKIGLDLIASGSNNSTIAILINGVAAKWHDAIFMKAEAIAGNVFRLASNANGIGYVDLATIDRVGNAAFPSLKTANVIANTISVNTGTFVSLTSTRDATFNSVNTTGNVIMNSVRVTGNTVLNTLNTVGNASFGSITTAGQASVGSLTINGINIGGSGSVTQTYIANSIAALGDSSTHIVPFDTEEFDTGSSFNTTSHIFSPTIAGYYKIDFNIEMYSPSVNIHSLIGYIFKNNVAYKYQNRAFTSGAPAIIDSVSVSSLVYLNGSTDYITCHYNIGSTSDASIVGGIGGTWFSAYLARG